MKDWLDWACGLLKRVFGGIRENTPMHENMADAEPYVDPQAILMDAEARERDAERAVERVKQQYHRGTDALTVAQAKVGVMQRYPSYTGSGDGDGEWRRKS